MVKRKSEKAREREEKSKRQGENKAKIELVPLQIHAPKMAARGRDLARAANQRRAGAAAAAARTLIPAAAAAAATLSARYSP